MQSIPIRTLHGNIETFIAVERFCNDHPQEQPAPSPTIFSVTDNIRCLNVLSPKIGERTNVYCFILCPSTLVIRRRLFYHTVLLICIYAIILDWVNFQKMLTLEANRVNLGHTSFLGVLMGAELKSSVCLAQKWPQMPQNPIWPPLPDLNVFMYIIIF